MGKHRRRPRSRSPENRGSMERRIRALERALARRHTRSSSRSRSEQDGGRRSSTSRGRSQMRSRSRSRSRRREISDTEEQQDVSEPEDDPIILENTNNEAAPLDGAILSLLGESQPTESKTVQIHEDVAVRWKHILQHGLPAEARSHIMSKYPEISNCTVAKAPQLNLEVKAILPEGHTARDGRLALLQNQISSTLSALGQVLSQFLEEKDEREGKKFQIEAISDACRLLSDLHHEKSKTRRYLILPDVNTSFKESLVDAPIDCWLFGEDLTERMKTAKALERSGQDLKPVKKTTPKNNRTTNHLNSKGPARQYSNFRNPTQRAGQSKTPQNQYQRYQYSRNQPQAQSQNRFVRRKSPAPRR